MADFVIDEELEDLDVSGGDMGLTSELDAIRQAVALQLRMVKGEWFLDANIGTDYYGQIFGLKNFIQVDAEFVRSIMSVPGVLAIIDPLEYNLDKVTRVLSVTFKLSTTAGTLEQTETVPIMG